VPYVDERAAEELLRHEVLRLLQRSGLLSQERIELAPSWRRSGFSVHKSLPGDAEREGVLARAVPRPKDIAARPTRHRMRIVASFDGPLFAGGGIPQGEGQLAIVGL